MKPQPPPLAATDHSAGWRRLAFALLLAALAGGAIGYWYVVPVKVPWQQVQPRLMSLEINGPGLLDAINRVVVTSRIQGFLKSIEADRNDVVKRGQVLALLESVDLLNQLAAAQAEATAAARGISEAESERARAKAGYDRAKIEFERRSSLARSNVISPAELTTAESNYLQAEADMARADAGIERAKAQLLSKQANVKVLEAKLAEATIVSPLDGVVISRERNPGDLLLPGANLMQVVELSTIIISARFDESARSTVKPGQPARIRFAADPNRVWTGKVLRLSRQVDQETREFTADITLDALPESWAMGQRANVAVEAQSPALTIGVPETFVTRRDGRPGVWLARNGRATWVPVTLGYVSGTNIEVTRGLKAGDAVLSPAGRYPFEPVQLGAQLP
ncbi:efflux RND transporter periplasmic adaptor subunit [Xanthobacter dioxanivorans]|uniref:Efflux RND transporter periplasmic adaptor subunit n=1 Tax=Xanthobacter dioxanivorans TaxID=2528964 RepID=A0A974SKS8_9HYPH|nr:efflux RND transporter periplasmic adaptor subunit [Xanthobacter dioxanivorans]QRG09160.1 efflux RND transporter periplasmic adaptor subunit [Xanthobacter dioxanivorans]